MESIFTDITYKKLEFDKILNKLQHYSLTSKCNEMLQNLRPSLDKNEIIKSYKILDDFYKYFSKEGFLDIERFYDFEKELLDADKNIVISEISLYRLALSLNIYFILIRKFKSDNFREIYDLFQIKDFESDFYKYVLKFIRPDGYVESRASKKLSDIRSSISSVESKIKSSAETFLKSARSSNYTTEDIITIRDGFDCIPIKANYKNRIDGIVIDSSSSGHTVFVVPQKTLELHNELIILQDKERAEIYIILKGFTETVRDNIDTLRVINTDLISFDLYHAKALYSYKNSYNIPEIIDRKNISIFDGRHPLLGKSAVPLDLKIGEDFNVLVITGPNTGGKTVVLKTVGLFCLMVQSGLGIPASSFITVLYFE